MGQLKCTIVIIGDEDDKTATALFEFDPPLNDDGKYMESGVGAMANIILKAIERSTTEQQRKIVSSSGVEVEW